VSVLKKKEVFAVLIADIVKMDGIVALIVFKFCVFRSLSALQSHETVAGRQKTDKQTNIEGVAAAQGY
jgi:hypothetical protein